jgi:glycosyltransferase involved in cell wall biosynthesis
MKFTVITVCRNEIDGIQRTIRSVCSQEFQNFEWVVIDGGSTDGTLDELLRAKSRISCLVSEKDEGIFNAMNKGLSLSHGEYVIFMNGGDSFYDENSMSLYEQNSGPDVIYGNLVFTGNEDRLKKYPHHIDRRDFLRKTLPHQASAVKRELLDRVGGFDESYKIAGDYDFFAKLFQSKQVTSVHIDHPLAKFDDSGISSQTKQRKIGRRENHRVRWSHVPEYRKSMKCWRHILKRCVGLA